MNSLFSPDSMASGDQSLVLMCIRHQHSPIKILMLKLRSFFFLVQQIPLQTPDIRARTILTKVILTMTYRSTSLRRTLSQLPTPHALSFHPILRHRNLPRHFLLISQPPLRGSILSPPLVDHCLQVCCQGNLYVGHHHPLVIRHIPVRSMALPPLAHHRWVILVLLPYQDPLLKLHHAQASKGVAGVAGVAAQRHHTAVMQVERHDDGQQASKMPILTAYFMLRWMQLNGKKSVITKGE